MQKFIQNIENIFSNKEHLNESINKVSLCVNEFIQSCPIIDEKYKESANDGYSRRIIHRDPKNRFTISIMAWAAGHSTPIHDHGTWGVIGVLENAMNAWSYKRLDDENTEYFAELKEEARFSCATGQIFPTVLPPNDEIHRLQNSGNQTCVTLHVYGRDVEKCRKFNIMDNTWEWYTLDYSD